MPEVVINGIPVNFPFEPYDVQKEYMASVIRCLQNGYNGILESPTGTGKTLSLLCSSLAWLMMCKAKTQAESMGISEDDLSKLAARKKFLGPELSAVGSVKVEPYAWGGTPKIYYASRTHSQLTQAVQELKRTAYAHIKSAVLGSRDQMCIHPEVSREPTNAGKVHMCHHRVTNRTCHFYNNVEARKDDTIFKESGPMDIEDLVKAGRKLQCCPYFMAKELKQEADIVFMPYNYILDPKSRKAHGVELENKVVILDEAHNIEKMCEESASLVLRSTDIAMCIDEVTKVMKEFGDLSQISAQVFNSGEDNLKDFTMEELCILKTLFLKLEDAVDSITLNESQKNDIAGETFSGSFMVDLLAKVGITNDKKLIVVDLLEKIIQYLTTSSMTAEGGSGSVTSFQRKGNGLQLFSDLLKVVFSQDIDNRKHMESVKKCYKVHVMVEDPKKKKKADSWAAMKASNVKANGRIINYWCLSPGFGMQTLVEQNLRSLILTSGTLAPLPPLISELGIPINVTLENPHIIKPHQVWLGVVKNGPDGYPLSSAYSSRDDPKYIASLGQTIVNFSRIAPDGLLIFFPSYPLMNACRDTWQQTGVWSRIQEKKPIFVEPQSREGLNSAMTEFYAKVKDPETNGACFMAVCRGKVSEGLDFADHNGRAVVVTGLPFPPYKDPRVILKRGYLDESRKNRALSETVGQSGQEWYNLEASRAVNQAIGRVIRHSKDYGAILLCDKRFDSQHFRNELSAWLRPHFKSYSNFGEVIRGMRSFFKNAETMCPQISRLNKPQSSTVGASFDLTSSRSVNKAESSSDSQATSEIPSTWKPEDYKSQEPIFPSSNAKSKETNFFSALESSSKAIDFNYLPQGNNMKRTEGNEQSASTQKKKKLKIAPMNLNLTENCCLNEENSPQEINLVSARVSNSNAVSGKNNKSKRASEIAAYLKEVKKNLETSKYKIFVSSVQSYTKDHDYSKLLECLKEVFISDPGLHILFRRFHRFLRHDHQDQFDLECISLTGKMCES